jgi:hypothetical protein
VSDKLTFEFTMDELVMLIKGLETAVDQKVLNQETTEPLETKFKIAFNKLHSEHVKVRDEYVKVRFGLYNDDNDPVYDGWYKPQDGRWNGWLQPYVDEKTYKQIYNDIKPSEQEMQSYDEDEREYWDDIKNQKPNKDGYYDVAHGICWMSEED